MSATTKFLRIFVLVCILSGSLTFAPSTRAVSPDIVISQVYGGGGNAGATYRNDYIELFNRGSSAVDVSGWSVQYASATGTTWQRTDLSGTIQPGQYYLVQQAAGAGGTADLPAPDLTGAINMSATAGKVALVKNQTTLTSACPPTDNNLADLIGYGSTANCSETAPTANLSNTTAAKRASNGCTDTDANNTDFTVADPTASPTPRNTASPFKPCSAPFPNLAVDDVSLIEGNAGTVTATFTVSLSALAGAGGVTFDIATADGTATTADSDYVARSLTGQTIPMGSSSATFDVTVNGDVFVEPDETFYVNVTNVSGATVTDGQGQGTIANDDTVTPVYVVQGSGLVSPLIGATVTVEGIVISDDEGSSPALRGFYLQASPGDGDPATSDGIFIFNGSSDSVSLGDRVLVTGAVSEYFDQTQVSAVRVTVLSSGNSLAPTAVTLPFPSADYPERYEGMLVRFAQTLYVTEHYLLGRFGQVTLSAGGRLDQPTNAVLPGVPALALQAANDLNRIIVDDPLQSQNPDPIPFGRGGLPLSTSNTLRGGDTVTDLVGVLTYTWGGNAASPNAYRLRPVNALGGGLPNFAPANPRPLAPPDVGGEIRAVGMNLFNYFNTFGTGNCANGLGGTVTDCRGAEDATEFQRQSDKIVNAILALDADVIGIVEMENDGYGPDSAIQDLVDKLNAATAPATYAFLDADALTGKTNALGADAIKVGLLYRPATLTPVGTTAVLDTPAFVNGGDSTARNRVSLLQAFQTNDGARFLVNVNHLKSKGSACDAPDAGDGQGNCSLVRLNAVNALIAWLASDPTGTGEPDLLILGDLNSYAREDPITALETAGFVSLLSHFGGSGAYSYAFDGQWGALDYALASPSLLAQVSAAADWRINADEPAVLDYNTNYKTPGQLVSLYSPEPFRTSDHDPLLVGLTLESGAPAVTINQAASQPDPATAAPILFDVLFSKPVTGFTAEDVVITGSAPGAKTVTVSGTGAAYTVSVSGMTGSGTVIASILAGAAQDFAGNPSLASASTDNTVTFGRPPTGVSLAPAAIPENQTPGSLVGLLAASDPDPGESHTFSLVSNPAACPLALDNASFQVPPGTNELRAVAAFDFETRAVYVVCLRAADPLGLSYDAQLTVSITDLNEPPSISLANAVASLPEDTDTASPVKVADILITDDALGVNLLSLSDSDAGLFEVHASALYLKAGAVLDFETNPVLDVIVSVDDPDLGAGPEDSVSLSISIIRPDLTAPAVAIDQAASQPDPANLAPLLFTVIFTEPVIGFTAEDVVITGSAPGVKTVIVTGSDAAYEVSVSGMTGSGTVTASIPEGAAQDFAGNPSLASLSVDNIVAYDVTAPVVVSVTRLDLDPASAASLRFAVTFSEPVSAVDASDFALTTSGLSGVSVSGVTGSGADYTVTVAAGSGSGTLRLDVSDNDSIRDEAGNPLGGYGLGNGSFTGGQVYSIRTTSFADVPVAHWAWQWIERLYAARITGGCGEAPLVYCPESSVTRAQMAVFLERGLNGASYTPPAGSGAVFGDVPASLWAAGWIEKLFADGLTAGCGNGYYCPEKPVTRAEMAVFLLRAKHGSGYNPPAATGVFADVPTDHWAAAWVEQLYVEDITSGCGVSPLTYCPENQATRAEMAVFLVRTFNLP